MARLTGDEVDRCRGLDRLMSRIPTIVTAVSSTRWAGNDGLGCGERIKSEGVALNVTTLVFERPKTFRHHPQTCRSPSMRLCDIRF